MNASESAGVIVETPFPEAIEVVGANRTAVWGRVAIAEKLRYQ